MSQEDSYPAAQCLRTWQGQKADYNKRLLDATLFPWNEGQNSGCILGTSLAAHYVRMKDLAREIEVPNTVSKKRILDLVYGHDDLPFLTTDNVSRELRPGLVKEFQVLGREDLRNIARQLKERYNLLTFSGIPYNLLVNGASIREGGVVGCIGLVDQVMMAEYCGENIEEQYIQYLERKWNPERSKVNRDWYAREINGRIGTLPMAFSIDEIRSSSLAELWRSKISRWGEGDLPKIISEEMNASYNAPLG